MVQQSPVEGWTMAELQLAMPMTIRVQMAELDKLVDIHYICLQYFQRISWSIPGQHMTVCANAFILDIPGCMQLSKQSCPSNTWDQLHVQEPHKTQPSNKAS